MSRTLIDHLVLACFLDTAHEAATTALVAAALLLVAHATALLLVVVVAAHVILEHLLAFAFEVLHSD